MLKNRVLEILDKTEARLEGHFLLSSGRHGEVYIQCGRVFQHADYAEELCKGLASKFSGEKIETVIGPALGAVLMAYETSKHLSCRNIFAERQDGEMVLRRGFSLKEGERVLIVEDAVTTGRSALEVVKLCRAAGAEIVGVGALVDRTDQGANPFEGIPFKSLVKLDIATWNPEECPFCKKNIPCVKPGSRPGSPPPLS